MSYQEDYHQTDAEYLMECAGIESGQMTHVFHKGIAYEYLYQALKELEITDVCLEQLNCWIINFVERFRYEQFNLDCAYEILGYERKQITESIKDIPF